ncbi:hypothetical protein BWI92_07415 [Flectobacillus sp. BAB-3569]|nr:hypothetical protein BWI92_07415 [Flectobacillus sp. BAB-3569]
MNAYWKQKFIFLVLGNTIPTFSTWHKANSSRLIKLYYFCAILYQKDTERGSSLIFSKLTADINVSFRL